MKETDLEEDRGRAVGGGITEGKGNVEVVEATGRGKGDADVDGGAGECGRDISRIGESVGLRKDEVIHRLTAGNGEQVKGGLYILATSVG